MTYGERPNWVCRGKRPMSVDLEEALGVSIVAPGRKYLLTKTPALHMPDSEVYVSQSGKVCAILSLGIHLETWARRIYCTAFSVPHLLASSQLYSSGELRMKAGKSQLWLFDQLLYVLASILPVLRRLYIWVQSAHNSDSQCLSLSSHQRKCSFAYIGPLTSNPQESGPNTSAVMKKSVG